MIKSFYAVRKGRENGVVVKSWTECEQLVKGYPGAIYKGFPLYQKDAAYKFAESGDYGKHTPKEGNKYKESKFSDNYSCIKRASYRDPFTGIYYKNRCVIRKGPTITGENYKPHIGNSLPWNE